MESNIPRCFPSVNTKEAKQRNKTEVWSNKIKPFLITRTLKRSSWGKSDHDENFHMWLNNNKDPFLISTVELFSSVSKSKKCFGSFLKSKTKKETEILFFKN